MRRIVAASGVSGLAGGSGDNVFDANGARLSMSDCVTARIWSIVGGRFMDACPGPRAWQYSCSVMLSSDKW